MQDTPTILHAEDDDGHALLVQNGLKKAGFHNRLVRFRDGQEALAYFTGRDGIAVTPMVLLLDVKMPKFDGIEVLRRIRGNSDFDAMPVIMLTTTDGSRGAAAVPPVGVQFLFGEAGGCETLTLRALQSRRVLLSAGTARTGELNGTAASHGIRPPGLMALPVTGPAPLLRQNSTARLYVP